jgi:hypothetical protein
MNMKIAINFASLDIEQATLDDVVYELSLAEGAAMEAIETLADVHGQLSTIRQRFVLPAHEAAFADRLVALLPMLLALKPQRCRSAEDVRAELGLKVDRA